MQKQIPKKISLGKKVLLNSEQVELEGPSEELLKLTVDISTIPNNKHMEFVNGLTKLLKQVDARFSKRAPRGDKRVFIGYAKNSKAATFYWVPLYLPNLLKQLRTIRYRYLDSHGEILKVGNKKVHIIQTHALPGLQNEIAELNERIIRKKVIKGINSYVTKQSWQSVKDYFASYGIVIQTPAAPIYDMTIEHSPISIDPTFYIQHAEQKVKEMMGRISAEEQKGLQMMEQRLREKEAELVKAIEEHFSTQLQAFVSILQAATSGGTKNIKTRYNKLKQKLVVSGADSKSLVFKKLDTMVDAISTKNPAAVLEASKEVAKLLQIKPRENATTNLRLASEVLKGDKASIFLELL
jgi:hypothetical protein